MNRQIKSPTHDLIRVRSSEFALRYTGYLLAVQPWPPDKCKETFRVLEGHRRRAWTRDRGDDFLPPRTTADLIWVGLFGCSAWRDDDTPATGAREFFFEVVERSRFLYLLDGGNDLLGRAATEAFTNCFVFAKRVLGSTTIEDVAALIEPVANDPVVLRSIFRLLRQHGVDDDGVRSICEKLSINETELIALANRASPVAT